MNSSNNCFSSISSNISASSSGVSLANLINDSFTVSSSYAGLDILFFVLLFLLFIAYLLSVAIF